MGVSDVGSGILVVAVESSLMRTEESCVTTDDISTSPCACLLFCTFFLGFGGDNGGCGSSSVSDRSFSLIRRFFVTRGCGVGGSSGNCARLGFGFGAVRVARAGVISNTTSSSSFAIAGAGGGGGGGSTASARAVNLVDFLRLKTKSPSTSRSTCFFRFCHTHLVNNPSPPSHFPAQLTFAGFLLTVGAPPFSF
jgi:hypothetical protein